MRQSGLITEKQRLEKILDDQDLYQTKFKDEVWAVVKQIDNYKLLKKSLVMLYKKYALSNFKMQTVDETFQLNKKRDFLEQSIHSVKENISKNSKENKGLKQRLLRHNVELIQEINMLESQRHKKILDIAILQGTDDKENVNSSNNTS